MTAHSFDVVVLGGGSGGYAAALRAAELGRAVALIEKDAVGGTCLHRGCVPTKALLHAAEVAQSVREAASVGIAATLDGVDPARLRSYREGIVARKHRGLQGLLQTRGVTVIEGSGRLDADGGVRVGEDTYTGASTVIATGARGRTIDGVEFGERVIGSDRALELETPPRRAIVLGGGVIGVEFASLWRSLGAEVTIIEAAEHLLPGEDPAVSRVLERAFRKRGIGMELSARLTGVSTTEDAVIAALADGAAAEGDVLLVAVGREPATDGLGLAEAGVQLDGAHVLVDERLRTTAENVWAVGDIVPGPQLAHRGFQQGIFVAEEIAGLSPVPVDDAHVPRVTYSSPEVASVGLTEDQAVAAHGADAVNTYEYNLSGNARSEILGTAGIVKVVRRTDGPVLGLHLAGDRVGELITEGQLAVAWEAHPEDIAPLVHAHPTQSEAIGEAFLALAGKPLHAL